MVRTARTGEQGPTLPYGPTRGMLQALQLMRRTTPSKIDGSFLRTNKIAPGNEYKVVGALRFLDIIDDDGRPTEKSRLLKTKGVAFTSALQDIVRGAYKNLFQHLNGNGHSQEDIYNYFVTKEGLGPEMATKTTRFFIQLCQMAEIDLGVYGKEQPSNGINGTKKITNGHRKTAGQYPQMAQMGAPGQMPFVLTITPELAAMDTNQLADFFKKLRVALAKASED
ncbi:MAG: DUF5343 domain-containing protein [Dehalococcoidia bacterium]|nr:DUF5343 domain-containing protein [Dehalococcoidia bacterium]